jgi:hypothetical protein
MKRSALIGLICGLLLCGPALACHPVFVRRTVVVAPAVPVVPVSTVLIAQFAPVYATIPTFTVGAAGYGTPGLSAGGIAPGVAPATPGQAPQSVPQSPPGPQPGGLSGGNGTPQAQPQASENERILTILSALEARLTALEGKLPPAQPPPADVPKEGPTKPAPKEGEKPGEGKQSGIPSKVHGPLAFLSRSCMACHAGQNAEGGLDLSAGLSRLTSAQMARVIARTATDSMPPRKEHHRFTPLTADEKRELANTVAFASNRR